MDKYSNSTNITDINCAFSYISAGVFLVGIIIYIYLLVVDSQYQESDDGREESIEQKNSFFRVPSEKVWVWGMFILLIIGFLISSYCIYKPSNGISEREKWTPTEYGLGTIDSKFMGNRRSLDLSHKARNMSKPPPLVSLGNRS